MEHFGTMGDGSPVERVTISGGGLTAKFLTYGAVLQDLRLEGHDAPLVLGFETFAPYLTKSPFFGATAGRFANRIRDGHLELDGKTHQLDRNFIGKHTLHGGIASTGKRLWCVVSSAADRVVLEITLPDGDMGFPGNLTAQAQFALLEGGVLDIQYTATTDATTLCSFAHHSYFNLDGGPTIADHLLQVEAPSFLPVDDELIPTGELIPVRGTPFDFKSAKTIGPVSTATLVDHNFCVGTERQSLRQIATLHSPASGVTMACQSTEPGLQVYDGANINVDEPGLDGFDMKANAGIALEPQVWPDAHHHAAFPQAVLNPGETYRQRSQYIFSKETS